MVARHLVDHVSGDRNRDISVVRQAACSTAANSSDGRALRKSQRMTTNAMSNRFAPRSSDDIRALVREQPLAWIVSGDAGALQATPLPVQLVCDGDGAP